MKTETPLAEKCSQKRRKKKRRHYSVDGYCLDDNSLQKTMAPLEQGASFQPSGDSSTLTESEKTASNVELTLPCKKKRKRKDTKGDVVHQDNEQESKVLKPTSYAVTAETCQRKSKRSHKNKEKKLINTLEHSVTAIRENDRKVALSEPADEVRKKISEKNQSESLHSLPADSVIACSKKKLLILDVNGLLADIVKVVPKRYKPDTFVSEKAVFKRHFCNDFLQFCFERFNVGVWSSRTKKNLDKVTNYLLGNSKKKLLFCWDRSYCTQTAFMCVDDKHKPIVLKELRKLWDKVDPELPWEKGEYNESNTLLLDDSPYKALLNPPNTAIFPHPYHFKNVEDKALGPDGDLRLYLEKLASAENVQKFIGQNPFGQRAITESNSNWGYYSRIIGKK